MSPLCRIDVSLLQPRERQPGDGHGDVGDERDRTLFDVIRDLDRGRMTVAAAAGLLALERRQVFRLLKTPTSLSGVDNRWVNYLGQAFITPHGEPAVRAGTRPVTAGPRQQTRLLKTVWLAEV